MEIETGGDQVAQTQTDSADPLAGITGESTSHPQTEPAAQEPEPVQEQPQEQAQEEKPKRPGKLEREILRLQKEVEELRKPAEPVEAPKPEKDPDAEPKMEDFDNVLDYTDARAEWKAKKALEAHFEQQKKTQEQTQADHAKQQRDNAFAQREQAFYEATPDYLEKVTPYLEAGMVPDNLVDELKESELGPQIAYHLADHPQDFEIISKLKGRDLTKAITLLEAALSNPSPQVRTTKAAAPITPVKGKSQSSEKSPADMSVDELDRWRHPERYRKS